MIEKENTFKSQLENLGKILELFPFNTHFKLHSCYNLSVPPSWMIKERSNEDLHMIFVKEGSGKYYLNNIEEPLKRGKIIFVSSNYPHSAIQDYQTHLSIIPVRFNIYDNLTNKVIPLMTDPFCFSLTPNNIYKYEQLFELLFKYSCINHSTNRTVLINSLICQLLCEIHNTLSYFNKYSIILNDPRIENVRAFINENPESRITIDEMALMVGLSPKYLTHLFKKQYLLTPKQYQTKIRIRYACSLLEKSDYTVKQLALELDYPDEYTFSKQFKQIMGYPPSKAKCN